MSEFEVATAEQLAVARGHAEPTESDINDAAELVKRWHARRVALGLEPWE